MNFDVITLFPEMYDSVLATSLLGRGIKEGKLAVGFFNPRDIAPPPHHSVDDTPYGGGPGMVMRADVLVNAIEHVEETRGAAHKILMCPTGRPLTQAIVRELAEKPRVMLICGRYEGYDERVRAHVDDQISIGDFVLSGGDLSAMVIIDAVSRRLPGVLGNFDSTSEESFEAGTLEYPQYTRPADFRGAVVPAVLTSGNHAKVAAWRRVQALRKTRALRPDLFGKLTLTKAEQKALDQDDQS